MSGNYAESRRRIAAGHKSNHGSAVFDDITPRSGLYGPWISLSKFLKSGIAQTGHDSVYRHKIAHAPVHKRKEILTFCHFVFILCHTTAKLAKIHENINSKSGQ